MKQPDPIASPPPGRRWPPTISESGLRQARLVSGLVLFAFVSLHIANLALALISLEAAEAGRVLFLALWRNPVGTLVFYGSALVHAALTLRALYLRRTLAMPGREAVQILFGLAIPLLLAQHVAGTRLFSGMSGVQDSYEFVIRAIWVIAPEDGINQTVALIAVWAHGCLGLHFWLRYRHWYPAAAPALLSAAVLLPVLGLLGFADAGRMLAANPAPLFSPDLDPDLLAASLAMKERVVTGAYAGFAGAVAVVLLLRELRRRRAWRDLVEIRYPDGQAVRVPRGHSVLEASRVGGIAHYSVCGGKGRCSTCRVRVMEGLASLPAASAIEAHTLARIHAEPDIRLACQLRPLHPVKVAPLLAADRGRALLQAGATAKPGREREIAVLFCDIRGFTALADRRLPYDVVFLLNRYFALVGHAVEESGGHLDKFIGDGAMALFGLDEPRDVASRQALAAAAAILDGLAALSRELANEVPEPLRAAIGIHTGPAIVGAMGYGGVMNVTAIGDTVNIASRLESAAKEFNAALVVSAQTASWSGLDLSAFEHREIVIRGRAAPLDVCVVPHGSALPHPDAQGAVV